MQPRGDTEAGSLPPASAVGGEDGRVPQWQDPEAPRESKAR